MRKNLSIVSIHLKYSYSFIIPLILLSLTNQSCHDANQTSTKIKSINDSASSTDNSQIKAVSIKEKIDTIIRDLGPKQNFKYNIYFGMTAADWNKSLAVLAKDGIVKELNEEANGNYFGIVSDNNFSDITYKLSGIFRNFSEQNNQTVIIHSINKVFEKGKFLCGIEYQYYGLDGQQHDVILNNLLNSNNLSLVHGNVPLRMTTVSEKEKGYLYLKRKGKEIAGIKKTERDTISMESESLMQNNLFYFVIKISETKEVTYSASESDEVSSVQINKAFANLNYKVYSKKFSDLDISQFMTRGEQYEAESKKHTDNLIKKALDKSD